MKCVFCHGGSVGSLSSVWQGVNLQVWIDWMTSNHQTSHKNVSDRQFIATFWMKTCWKTAHWFFPIKNCFFTFHVVWSLLVKVTKDWKKVQGVFFSFLTLSQCSVSFSCFSDSSYYEWCCHSLLMQSFPLLCFLGKDKDRDTRSKSQSKEPDREKRHSRSAEKERKSRGHSPASRSDEDRVQSEGDTKKDWGTVRGLGR